jgi:hypothetical protein
MQAFLKKNPGYLFKKVEKNFRLFNIIGELL